MTSQSIGRHYQVDISVGYALFLHLACQSATFGHLEGKSAERFWSSSSDKAVLCELWLEDPFSTVWSPHRID